MAGESILIVEQGSSNSDDLQSKLLELGYRIAGIVSNGSEALRTLTNTKTDLVIVEICFSHLVDGITVASQIRCKTALPVIIVMDGIEENLKEQIQNAGYLYYFDAPYSSHELKIKIEACIAESYFASDSMNAGELRYRRLFENAMQGIFCIAKSGQFIDVNASFAKSLGYDSPKDLVDAKLTGDIFFVSSSRHKN